MYQDKQPVVHSLFVLRNIFVLLLLASTCLPLLTSAGLLVAHGLPFLLRISGQ